MRAEYSWDVRSCYIIKLMIQSTLKFQYSIILCSCHPLGYHYIFSMPCFPRLLASPEWVGPVWNRGYFVFQSLVVDFSSLGAHRIIKYLTCLASRYDGATWNKASCSSFKLTTFLDYYLLLFCKLLFTQVTRRFLFANKMLGELHSSHMPLGFWEGHQKSLYYQQCIFTQGRLMNNSE